jgi:hypothetical protein
MRTFKNWLFEGTEDAYEGRKPHHIYHTEHGHEIHVHMDKNPKGTHATFLNKSLGGGKTKLVHWNAGATPPSKQELEKLGNEEELNEELNPFAQYLIEKAPPKTKIAKPKKEAQHVNDDGSLSINAGGKVTELATVVHLIGHKHMDAGTHGSPEHEAEVKPYKDEIEKMTKGANKDAVQLRIEHGRAAANAIKEEIKQTHGEDAKIVNVGHTAKPGDIPKFTRGVHNDGQENTADAAVEIGGSTNKPHPDNSDGTHFEGYSLKSSKQGGEITGKNPSGNMNGEFDSPTRKLQADEVGRAGLKKYVHEPMGVGDLKAARRAEKLQAHRDAHLAAGGKKNESEWELEANERNRDALKETAGELHNHLQHLMSEGNHHIIGKALQHHLMPDTDMPLKKVKAVGNTPEKTRAIVEPNSDHPLKKILKSKKTKYYSKQTAGGAAVQVGYVHPETGEQIPLTYYTPKTKSSAYKSDNMSWNVRPVKFH